MREPTTIWLCSAIAGLAALCWAGCNGAPGAPPAAEEAAAIAHLELTSGTVKLEREHRRSMAELGYLYTNDAFETGALSGMKIRFPGVAILEVGPEAQLVLGQDNRGTLVNAAQGSFQLVGSPSAEGAKQGVRLILQTPFGRVKCRPDSEVSVQVSATLARVEVNGGAVELEDNKGSRIKASDGERFILSADGLSGEEAPAEPVATKRSGISSLVLVAWMGDAQGEVHPKGSSRWTRLAGRSPRLGPGETLRISEGVFAVELSEGVRLLVGRGSELIFEGLDAKTGEGAFGLEKGELSVSIYKELRQRVVVSGVELAATGPAYFSASRSNEDIEVTSFIGDLEFKKDVLQGRLGAGQLATIQQQKALLREVVRADLVLPSRLGLKVHQRGLDWVALSWEGGRRDYRVEVAMDQELEEPVLKGLVHRAFINFPAPSRGSLYWRVLEPNGAMLARGSATFSPEPSRDLGRLRNEVPERPEKTTIFYADRTPGITFTFRAEPNASKYRVSVYRGPEAGRPIWERVVTQNPLALEPGLLPEGSYLWGVTPISANGAEIGGRRMNKLDLVFDNSEATLVVRSPKNGEPLRGNRVQVAGVAPLGSKLLVNGRPAPLDEKNRFELTVAPIGRSPLAIFRLLRPSEPDLFVVRSLRRNR